VMAASCGKQQPPKVGDPKWSREGVNVTDV
jgi:hypothetical protein